MEILNNFGIDLGRFFGQLAIWLVLFIILKKYAFGPILNVLEERKRLIAEGVANAERIRQELEAAEKKRVELMAQAGAEGNRLIEEAKKSADLIGAKKVQEAVQQAETLIRKAEEAAALDRERMMGELKQELGRLVVATTSQVTGKILTAEDQVRLQKETISGLAVH
ncbi:MAG: F0F1 ATP synthase subunit B [Methylacidiphilales bacterium]|nr:F0F1 ATP synthase subunit B [Candidatus Methylacidiphilales bacterium]